MRRFISVSLLVLALPFVVSIDNKQAVNSSASMVAYAGRSVVGGYYCTCHDAGCIFDPGECGGNTNAASVPRGGDSSTRKGSMDSASSVMMIAVALLLLLRLGVR